MVKFYSSVAMLIILGLGVLWFGGWFKGQRDSNAVRDFNSCVLAGNPVMESYPRKCRASDGEIYTEQVKEVFDCSRDSQCAGGQFCDGGYCREFLVQNSCDRDAECKLINRDLNFGCCWAGVCEKIDYSKDQWIPVNRRWFEDKREAVCGIQSACGPRPACSANLVNDTSEARCVGGICKKMPIR